jgi:hypothetical protein
MGESQSFRAGAKMRTFDRWALNNWNKTRWVRAVLDFSFARSAVAASGVRKK